MKMKATVSLFLLVCATLLISTLGRIRSKKIYSEFNEYYADEFLKELPSHMKREAHLVFTIEEESYLHSSLKNGANVPLAEYQALHDFYDALGGQWWNWNLSLPSIPWNFTQGLDTEAYNNPCADDWQGISCHCNDTLNVCNVQAIALDSFNLSGTIPDSIGAFKQMSLFDVGKNNIYSTLPETLGDLKHMSVFIVNICSLEGHIPEGMYDALNMTYFDVSDNSMSGGVSDKLGQWTNLQVLYLDHNEFTGTIPNSIGNLTKINYMEMEVNSFNGTIPAGLGNLKDMYMFLLFENDLTGTIPPELGNLESVIYFELYYNQLHGHIPPEITQCSEMKSLYLMYNQLSGPIPEDIGDLTELNIFEVYYNQLTGSLPDSLYNLKNLVYLEAFGNHLTGTISDAIGNFVDLSYFQMNKNQFHGSLPDAISSLGRLLIIDVSQNQMTGSIPRDIGGLVYMQYLMIYSNQFTTILPLSIGKLQSLTHFVGYQNLIEGPIPPGLVDLKYLNYIDFHFNELSGPIPLFFEKLTKLTFLCLYGNKLTGTLQEGLSQLPVLQQLFINDNRFTGNLNSFYNTTLQPHLTNIDLSANSLTGTIPDSLFDLPGLATLSLTSNCITGSLPAHICTATRLTALSLDGLHAAPHCVNFILPKDIRVHKTYTLTRRLKDIPQCLFSMPNIQTLHISGNGITGTLPSDLNITHTLSDLALSHNELYGSIPEAIVLHRTTNGESWLNLDLSYNKLSGVVDKHFPVFNKGQQLSLQRNRLSGHIADNLMEARDINILDGNIFSCESTGSEEQGLPVHDPSEPIYECGSNSCNQALYLWISIVGSILVLLLAVALSFWHVAAKGTTASVTPSKTDSPLQALLKYFHSLAVFRKNCMAVFDVSFTPNQSQSILQFGVLLNHIRRVFIVLSIVIVCVLMPIYCVLTTYYNTYDYEYAWYVSAAFLAGVTPALVLLVALTVFVLIIIFLYDMFLFPLEFIHPQRYRDATGQGGPTDGAATSHTLLGLAGGFYAGVFNFLRRRRRRFRYNMFALTLIVLNCSVVLVINGVYIYISITYNRTIVTLTQISFAVFKIFWNSVVVFDVYLKLKRTYFFDAQKATPSYRASLMTQGTQRSSHSTARLEGKDILVQSFIVMFNNIASPCLAIAVISTNCFYNAFFNPPWVEASYNFLYCTNMLLPSGTCTAWTPEILSTKYYPPFSYSYECSSVFVTTYTTVYIYMFIISCVVPVLVISGKMMHTYLEKESKESTLYRLLDKLLPNIVKPLSELQTKEALDDPMNVNHASAVSPLISDIGDTQRDSAVFDASSNSLNSDILSDLRMSKISSKHAQDSLVEANNLRQLFQTPKYMVSIVCNLGILITFGALFPPLAVVICVCTCVHTHYVQLLIGNVLVQATEPRADGSMPFFHYSYRLDEECDGVNRAFQSTIWLLLIFASAFYAFFLFDILGDDVGWRRALWAPLVMFFLPTAIYLLLRVYNRVWTKCCGGGGFGGKAGSGSSGGSRVLRSSSANYSVVDANI